SASGGAPSGGVHSSQDSIPSRRITLKSRAWKYLPDRVSAAVLDLLPRLPDQRGDAAGDGHVIQFFGYLAAVLISPIEELQRRQHDSRLVRRLVNQDEACAGNRPAVRAGLVCEHDMEAG